MEYAFDDASVDDHEMRYVFHFSCSSTWSEYEHELVSRITVTSLFIVLFNEFIICVGTRVQYDSLSLQHDVSLSFIEIMFLNSLLCLTTVRFQVSHHEYMTTNKKYHLTIMIMVIFSYLLLKCMTIHSRSHHRSCSHRHFLERKGREKENRTQTTSFTTQPKIQKRGSDNLR